ncbi:hypothetical protein Y032_0001g182 [Ancylostoma ceylanicum]|uniref:Saposin B-type domain-containing protein n=1 Tax=Ancylostoma ceylanicum TaxID=53326 RepID=A0A016W3U1_9BILA|nr:hypothetical protein Y032_0001g182 [Ancylostoma ceylanicum]
MPLIRKILGERSSLFIALLCGVVVAMPQKPGGIDNCGAKTVKSFKLIATGDAKMDIVCEMCLDMVLIAETYAECGEAEVEAALEKKCDKDFSSPATDKMCRSMVDKIAHKSQTIKLVVLSIVHDSIKRKECNERCSQLEKHATLTSSLEMAFGEE